MRAGFGERPARPDTARPDRRVRGGAATGLWDFEPGTERHRSGRPRAGRSVLADTRCDQLRIRLVPDDAEGRAADRVPDDRGWGEAPVRRVRTVDGGGAKSDRARRAGTADGPGSRPRSDGAVRELAAGPRTARDRAIGRLVCGSGRRRGLLRGAAGRDARGVGLLHRHLQPRGASASVSQARPDRGCRSAPRPASPASPTLPR